MTSLACHRNGVSDVLITAYQLGIDDDETLGRVARMLGFDLRVRRSAQRVVAAAVREGVVFSSQAEPRQAALREEVPSDREDVFDPQDDAWVELESSGTPVDLGIHLDVEPFPMDDDTNYEASPDVPSLFQPQWNRAILQATLATTSLTGDLDVDRIVEIISRNEIMAVLPRQPLQDTRRGVQLLCDIGESMQPFLHDIWATVESAERLLPSELLQVLVFDGTPICGVGCVGEVPFEDYKPPRSGTPVLALSEFGAGLRPPRSQAGLVADWLKVADILGRARCPLLAYCPYELSRVPKALLGTMTIIPWDRRTTTSVVLRRRISADFGGE